MAQEPIRCLAVDDDADVRMLITEALAGLGMELVVLEDGDTAWQKLLEERFDIALLDITLPGVDGWELITRIRAHERLASCYIVALAALGARDDLYRSLEHGADDHVGKPFDPRELQLRLGSAMRVARMQRSLSAQAEQLDVINKRQTEFYSIVAHEIRTPMTAILSSARIILNYGHSHPEKMLRFAEMINHEGERLLRLINNLLDLNRIEANRMSWSFVRVDLGDLVEHIRSSFAELAQEREVTVVTTVDSGLEQVTADEDKLAQIISNLVANAIRHSPHGGTVTVSCELNTDDSWRLTVEDTGSGVPAEIREQLFERFVRADRGRVPGTGLGLALVRQFVEGHGGEVQYEPRAPHGARFFAVLPLHAPPTGEH
jgi:signal transduction histidine kinase